RADWQADRATRAERRAESALAVAQEHQRLAEGHLHAALLRQARQATDLGQLEQAQDILEEVEAGPDGDDRRDFAWCYSTGMAQRAIVQLRPDHRRHSDFALAPDGQTLAIVDSDCRIRLWDLATRRPRVDLTGTALHASYPVFSPDGRRLVAIEGDATMKL